MKKSEAHWNLAMRWITYPAFVVIILGIMLPLWGVVSWATYGLVVAHVAIVWLASAIAVTGGYKPDPPNTTSNGTQER